MADPINLRDLKRPEDSVTTLTGNRRLYAVDERTLDTLMTAARTLKRLCEFETATTTMDFDEIPSDFREDWGREWDKAHKLADNIIDEDPVNDYRNSLADYEDSMRGEEPTDD